MLLYIHIPFCDSKCFYCAFNSYVDMFHLKKEYMKALKIQVKNDLEHYCSNNKLKTVFIGGGTPSCIDAQEYEEVFSILKPFLMKNAEITSEANPNSASKTWLQDMYNLGVNRISFGVQSFNDDKLKFLGRSHKAKSAISAIENAKSIGFQAINCDIIYGVHNDTFASLKKDFDIIQSLEINHLSAYSLIIEEGTKFFNKKKIKIDDEDLSYEIFDYLKTLGFNQYEISNFSKDKKDQSKHNFGYWEYDDYLGIGAGAVACINSVRYYPKKDIQEYINNPLKYEKEYLSTSDIKTEKVLLGFRCSNGVVKNILNSNELKKVQILIDENKVIEKNKRIYNKNYLLADEISLFILD